MKRDRDKCFGTSPLDVSGSVLCKIASFRHCSHDCTQKLVSQCFIVVVFVLFFYFFILFFYFLLAFCVDDLLLSFVCSFC